MKKYWWTVLLLFCVAFSPSNRKDEYLSGVIYAEAGGESIMAKRAVATVIWERANGDPSKIHSVITIPKHFASPKKEEVDEWNDCMELARKMYWGEFKPVIIKLSDQSYVYPTHFYSGEPPYWAKNKPYAEIGKLKFIRLEENND